MFFQNGKKNMFTLKSALYLLLFFYSQVNSRIKGLKRQLDETEEEVSREKAARRKTQRELEDLIADNESKEREITNLKNKLR
jgi:cell division protein FtsB